MNHNPWHGTISAALDNIVDSTPTIVFGISSLAFVGVADSSKTLQDLLITTLGAPAFLLILLVFACFGLHHLRNRLRESKDRERTFERAIAALEMRADVLEERLKFFKDQSEQLGKIIEQRNLLIDQKLAVGEELLRLEKMRSLIGLLPQPTTGALFQEILLVEDERALHYFKEGIEAEIPGVRVCLASNGAEALAAMKIHRPGLIITDLVMPVVDGFQLIAQVRDNYPDIAVLAISSYVDNAAQIAVKIGALPARFEFLPKPILLATIVDAIRRMMTEETKGDDAAVAV